MTSLRWWHLAVVGTAGVLSLIVLFDGRSTTATIGSVAANAVFAAAWLLIGRRFPSSVAAGTTFIAITIVTTGVAVAFAPWMAVIQCVVYPIVWTVTPRVRTAIFANVGIATSVGIGLYLGSGADQDALVQSVIIQFISLSFSIALGIWISSIADRSQARQLLLDELHAAQSELAIVNRDSGIASERDRLAREIHDTIAQDLTGLVLLAQRSRRELDAGDHAAASAGLEILEEGARNALAETRALVAATTPPGLENSTISDAIVRLGERFERETGIAVTTRPADAAAPVDRATEVALLRCAQEALANVRKHSRATSVALGLISRGGTIALTVSDNGRGFNASTATGGFGLAGMRERLALVSGTLSITSGDGGTTLVATLPVGTQPAGTLPVEVLA